MKTLTKQDIRSLKGKVQQEGRYKKPIPTLEFDGYRASATGPGGVCWLGNRFVELEHTEMDIELKRRPFSVEWKEVAMACNTFRPHCKLLDAIRDGKCVTLFYVYEEQPSR